MYFRKHTGLPVIAFVRSNTNKVNLSDVGKQLGRNYEFRDEGAFGKGFYNKTVFRNQNNLTLSTTYDGNKVLEKGYANEQSGGNNTGLKNKPLNNNNGTKPLAI